MCNCSAKKAGKIIGGFAGITTLFSVIVMIIAAVTLQYRIDPETMQKCPNSKGAYTTTCGTKRRLGEVHNLQTIPSVSFPSWSTAAETAAYFEDWHNFAWCSISLFRISDNAHVLLVRVYVEGGVGGRGGCFYVSEGTLLLNDVILRRHVSIQGGAIYLEDGGRASMTATNST